MADILSKLQRTAFYRDRVLSEPDEKGAKALEGLMRRHRLTSITSAAGVGVMVPEVGLLRGIGGASFPESCSEETSVDGGDEEGDYLENDGKGALSISTTATGCVCETNRRIYSRSEMEDLRFLDIDAQRRMWNAVYAGMESDVAREYSWFWVPDDQKKWNHENLVWDKFARKKGDFGENDGKGALSISTTATGCVYETNRRIYSRSEMEDLRFLDVDAQRRMWNAVYAAMESDVAREYSKLWVPDDQKKGKHENLVWDKFVRKKDDFGAVGEGFSFNMMESGIFFSSDNAYGETLVGSENYTINEVSFCDDNNVLEFEIDAVDDDDSDDEYDSIQRPAFLVEGEPDFDSGPPLDGLEYLRRVRGLINSLKTVCIG